MGSYHRIIIVFILIVCIVGLHESAARGDGTAQRGDRTSPSSSTMTPQRVTTSDDDMVTIIGTTIITIREEINPDSSQVTPSRQTSTRLTSPPESTNGTTQNVTPAVEPSKASPAALVSQSVSTGLLDVTEEIDTGTTGRVNDGAGGEETIQTTGSELMTNGVDVTTGQVPLDLEEGTTLANAILTSKFIVLTEDISTARDELPITTQYVPSLIESADITTLVAMDTTHKDGTTDLDMTTTLATTFGEFGSTSETLTTSDHITAAPLTTPGRATTPETLTTSDQITAAQLTTPERATTSETLTTSDHITAAPLTTPERATTAMIHTSLPPTTPEHPVTTAERVTTSMIRTSPPSTPERQASTHRPSTSHPLQTTEERHDSNKISASDLSSSDLENIVTLHFRGITVNDWYSRYDVFFRNYLSATLTSDTLTVRPDDLYYIIPTPLKDNNILYVSFIARSSSAHKRSTMPVVPLNETLGALSNLTALTEALGIPSSQAPTISTDLPDFIQNTLPVETTEEPLTTRKPPPTIGFLSNPGLFISLVVIATVSTIIIIVGLIYLLCDRRRSRSGEYITNHTPRNSDLELGFDNPVMAENDKAVSNGNHLASIKGEMDSDMIVPYDNFTQEELMNYEVEDTHL